MTTPRAVREYPQGYLGWKDLKDGRAAFVVPILFGRARLIVGPRDEFYGDDVW